MSEPDGLPYLKLGRDRYIHIETARQWLFSRRSRRRNPPRRREPRRPLSLAASQPTKPLSAETQNDAPKDAVCIFWGGRFAEGPAMTRDRATVVTQVLVDALVDVMTTIIRTEFRRRFTEILRDKFREERQQAAADRARPTRETMAPK